MTLKICAISDTHNQYRQLKIPECDLLIHAGDETLYGSEDETRDFARWLSEQPARHIVWTPGNHSLGFEEYYPESRQWILEHAPKVNILLHSDVVLEGVRVWGSPATPRFHDWAYNFDRGEDIREMWDRIPDDTAIVVTHGPPLGLFDRVVRGGFNVGCEDLRKRLERLKPKVHVFGHIHEGYGMRDVDGTTYINAAVVNERCRLINKPVELEI